MEGDAKELAEDKLARVQDALKVADEAKHKAKDEIVLLEVERTSLLLDIGAVNNEVSSLHFQEGKDKEVMEEDYQKALELIFTNGYGCCVFKHNIYGDQPEVLDGMPDSFDPLPLDFFTNSRCPLARAPTEVIATEAK